MMLYYIHILYRYLLIYVRTMFHIHRDWFGAPPPLVVEKSPRMKWARALMRPWMRSGSRNAKVGSGVHQQ